MQDLIWLLLPVAAAGGWFAARRSKADAEARPDPILSPEYLRGLNYLLNEQPDKAIDVFIRMLAVTADTFETHLALGNLFRKRGEVDRAIRIHQNLIARDSISNEQRTDALMELGQDYLRAGLLDRAEALFLELVEGNKHLPRLHSALLDIYQQEREWDKAIRIAEKMDKVDGRPAGRVIAQFLCELAEEKRHQGAPERAREILGEAQARDSRCARASILLGDIEREAGRYDAALTAYRCVEEQDIEMLPEVLESMYACHGKLGTVPGMIEYLQDAIPRYQGISPVLFKADILAREKGGKTAAEFIAGQLARRPSVRGLAKYVELNLPGSDPAGQETLMILKHLTDQLQRGKPVYACTECGFPGKTLHWQCPGCKRWDTIKPIHGVEGD